MTDEQERKAFEAWAKDRYLCSEHSFARSQDGYAHSVAHRILRTTYSSVQMMWESWQASRANRTASEADARDEIVYRALVWATWNAPGERTAKEVRAAAETLFGKDAIDAAMLAAGESPK